MGAGRPSRIRDSPTVWMSLILVLVYVIFGIMGGDLVDLNICSGNTCSVAVFFVQVNELVWRGWVWMLFTAMFLHANLVHLFGNVLFLLIFGTSLEEQVSKTRWLVTYFASGLAGNLAFLFLGPLLEQEVALGASGAVYGMLGAAGGLRGAALMIFLLGLNLFAGGGFLAHAAGLLVGLVLRQWWDPLTALFRVPPSGSPQLSD